MRALPLDKTVAAGIKYIHALHDPFDERAHGTGIPDLFCVPSQKYSVRTVGSFNTGSNGVGGLAFHPFQMFASDHAVYANYSTASIIATSSTYNQSDFNVFDAWNVDVNDATHLRDGGSNSPYTRASFGAGTGRSIRLVGAAIRIRYVGKVLDSSGSVTVFQNPSLSNSLPSSADDIASLLAVQTAYRGQEVPGKTWELCYTPLSPIDLEPIGEPGQYNGATPGASALSLYSRLAGGFAIVGTEPGAPYDYEAVAHFEAYGRGLPKTGNIPAVQAAAAAIALAPPTGKEVSLAQRAANVKDKFLDAMAPLAFQQVATMIGSGIAAYGREQMFKTI